MKKAVGRLALLLIVVFMVASCATTQKIQTISYHEYSTPEPTQVQGGLTLTCNPLSPDQVTDYPELFQFSDAVADIAWKRIHVNQFYPKDASGLRWAYTFGIQERSLVVVSVTVKNETDHILRMGDARIYLRIPGYEPIKAFTTVGDTNLTPVLLGDETKMLPKAWSNGEGLVGWITNAEIEFEATRPKGMISWYEYPVGICSQVIAQNRRAYKLISDVELEILPGDTYTGLLLFPSEVGDSDASVKFYDITTKTDAAGNPTEKVTFEFPLKSKHIQKWFNQQEKKWIDGQAPTPAG